MGADAARPCARPAAPRKRRDGSLAKVAVALRYGDLEALFEAVGETLACPAWVVQQLVQLSG